MKQKRIWLVRPVFIAFAATDLLFAAAALFFDWRLAVGIFVVTLVISAVAFWRLRNIQQETYQFLQDLGEHLNLADREALHNFPIPVIVVSGSAEIIWYNDRFRNGLLDGEDAYGVSLSAITDLAPEEFCASQGVQLRYKERDFKVFGFNSGDEENPLYMLYFTEDTEIKQMADEYKLSRPSVLIILIDNYEELMQNAKESEKSRVLGEIDFVLEAFMAPTTGFIYKLSSDRFLAVVEERHLQDMIQNRFRVLDEARQIKAGDSVPVTLSIGVGRGAKTLAESEQFAKQGLDMALGRGGDQVAVKTAGGFDFYGGVSKGYEKRTKVKTRIIAAALNELIEASDNVIVMGHRFGDLDCTGAAIAMAQAMRRLGKDSFVAVDQEKSLAKVLIQRVKEQEGNDGLFLHPEVAISRVTAKTLMIVVDTHNPEIVESKELLDACRSVVVIDHHRKMVHHIENAVIFFHEPYASSASEMVTELMQYMGDSSLVGRIEAEALMAGIMLDTRNFVIRTGVRTFEAAAYLRRRGADTVEVRKMFSSTIDAYQRRARLVAGAEIYRNCAIATADFTSEDLRIVAPQAADELLTISGVQASFVLYGVSDEVSISARSLGELNVQLVMESLGGGGHMTMSGAQLKNTSMEKARQMLLEAIDKYYETR